MSKNFKVKKKAVYVSIIIVLILLICAFMTTLVITLAKKGTDAAKENERDVERKVMVKELSFEITSLFLLKAAYPHINLKNSMFVLNGQESRVASDYSNKEYLVASSESDSDSTAYCYIREGKSYALGVQLENGEWFYVNDNVCDESNLVQ
ncbi:MAG TPA: hypothetical protein VGA67_05195 [Candidatus Dojkabacteria bacterium]|jgi:hypothetical protein